MAKAPVTPELEGVPPQLRIKGVAVGYWHQRLGRFVIQKWPKAPQQRSAAQIENEATFKAATKLIKQLCASEYQNFLDRSRATPLLWRDLAMKAIYGLLIEARTADGQAIRGIRAVQSDIQQLLNSISNVDGSMLVRVGGDWVALLPGDADQVITMNPSTGLPEWADAQGGGSSGTLQAIEQVNTGTASYSYASVGSFIIVDRTITLHGALVTLTAAAGGKYKCFYAPWDNGAKKITAAPVYIGDEIDIASAGDTQLAFKLATPASLSPGNYLIALVRVDGSTTVSQTMHYSSSTPRINVPNVRVDYPSNRLTLASLAPTTSDAWSSTAGCFCISPVYEWSL